jgi:hypothetical protein
VAGILDPPRVPAGVTPPPTPLGARIAQVAVALGTVGVVALAWARAFGRV